MRKRIAFCIAASLCAVVYAGNNPGIYKKGWIDFNKNGVKDVYEDPAAPLEARAPTRTWRPARCAHSTSNLSAKPSAMPEHWA